MTTAITNEDIQMICPTELKAYDLQHRPYHKLWGGCGWIGLRSSCMPDERDNGSIAWTEYQCPECGCKTDEIEQHKRDIASVIGLPPLWMR